MYDLNGTYGCYNNGEFPNRQLFNGEHNEIYINTDITSYQNEKDMMAINICLSYHNLSIDGPIELIKNRYYKIYLKSQSSFPVIALPICDKFGSKLRIYFPSNNLDMDLYDGISDCVCDFGNIMKRSIFIDICPCGKPILVNKPMDYGLSLFRKYLNGDIIDISTNLQISGRSPSPFIPIHDIFEGYVLENININPSKDNVFINRYIEYKNHQAASISKAVDELNKIIKNKENKNED